jgi:hypothetical protein
LSRSGPRDQSLIDKLVQWHIAEDALPSASAQPGRSKYGIAIITAAFKYPPGTKRCFSSLLNSLIANGLALPQQGDGITRRQSYHCCG